jgi:BON domain-containing protein
MIDLPFGSVSSVWPAVPLAAWAQASGPMLNRPGAPGFASQSLAIPTAATGVPLRAPQPVGPTPPDVYSVGGGPMGFPQIGALGVGLGLPMVPQPFVLGGYPGILAPPLAPPTLSALLMAVAIRRGQPSGPTNDQEIEDFIYDVFELLPGTNDVEIRCEGGRATLTGTVQHKRLKHDVGELVWAIPGINDVQNTVAITTKRRTRGTSREAEPPPATTQRK